MVSLLLDGLLAALLVAVIVYAAMLDRRLRVLRQSRDELQALLTSFAAATAQAQSGMAALRESTQAAAKDLKGDLDRAKSLRDDLAFLTERGDDLAGRLEAGARAARASLKAEPAAQAPTRPHLSEVPRPAARPADAKPAAAPADPAVRELMRALKAAR